MFNIRVANKEDHAEQITANNCAMALETENKILDKAFAKFGVSRVFDNKELGFYLVAENKSGVIASLMITYEWSDWRNALFWWIQSVYVRPEYRQKGVYKQMHETLRGMAKQSNLPVCGFRLYAEENNNIAHFAYLNVGMKKCEYIMFEES